MKKQQIKVKIWIWGPGTVNYNMTYAQAFFQKSLHPIIHGHAHTYYLLRGVCHEISTSISSGVMHTAEFDSSPMS